MWFRELSVIGAYGRQIEQVDGRSVNSYQLVLEMIADGRLNVNGLLTHRFRLGEYKKALAVAMHKRQHGAIKVAFDFR
jgi:threonine dehydrogenase-like Zn-dependent dehydrogenase